MRHARPRPLLRSLSPACLALSLAAPLGAGTLAVTTTADGGPGSLREALALAAAAPGPDTVLLPAGIYAIGLGTLEVSDPAGVVVEGAGARHTTIDALGSATAFEVGSGALLTVRGATITGGTSPGGFVGGNFHVDGHLVLEECTVRDGVALFGGGVRVSGQLGSVVVRRSTFVGNQGYGSAIESQQGDVTVSNSTIVGNTGAGGALRLSNAGLLDVRNSTIVGNESGLVLAGGNATGSLFSSIVWDNGGGDTSETGFGWGTWLDQGSNLIGDTNGTAFAHPTTRIGLDPLLGAPGLHGGPTITLVPRRGSPAIDAGANADLLLTDQRGAGYPRTIGGVADVGAVEATWLVRRAGAPEPRP